MKKAATGSDKGESPERLAIDPMSLSVLLPQVYDELRRLARKNLQRERTAGSIQATALVHEAYLRLKKDKHHVWQNRTHFFAIAASLMRRILVDRARSRAYLKRGGGMQKVCLDEALAIALQFAPEPVLGRRRDVR